MSDTTTTVNVELLTQVLQKIEDDPESWYQGCYARRGIGPDCGTSFCFAGHAVVLAGLEIDWDRESEYRGYFLIDDYGRDIPEAAEEVLGLSWDQAENLFAADNTMQDLRLIVAELIAGATA